MPEIVTDAASQTTTPAASPASDPISFGAADIAAARAAQEAEAGKKPPQTTTPDPDETEEEEDGGEKTKSPEEPAPEDGADKPRDPEGKSDEGDSDERPEVTEDDKNNPAIAKRIDELETGYKRALDKAVAKVEADGAAMQELMPKFERVAGYMDRINASPESADEALAEILEATAKTHKVSVADLLGGQKVRALTGGHQAPSELATEITDENWQEHFTSQEDYDYFRKIGPIIRAAILKEMGVSPDELKAAVTERKGATQRAQAEQARKTYLATHLNGVQAYFKTNFDGFEVTDKMLTEALDEFPTKANAPNDAIKAKYAEQLAAHMRTKTASKPRQKEVPDGLGASATPGAEAIKDLDDINAAAINRARKAQTT